MNTMLPIGSVVELENDDKKYVIVGFLHQRMSGNTLNVYQYTACEYSLGIDERNDFVYFDENEIDNILFIGYTIQFDRIYLRLMHEFYDELKKGEDIEHVIDNVLSKHYTDENQKKEIKDKFINNLLNNERKGGNENE